MNDDFARVANALGNAQQLSGTKIIITGGAGFVGTYLCGVLAHISRTLVQPCTVYCLDRRIPVEESRIPNVTYVQYDVTQPYSLDVMPDYIIHAAGIASPPVYRKYPIETMDINTTGLRHLLDFARGKSVRSILYFSSSEVYGDPDPEHIPTNEEYRGSVSFLGPRACYDESKRFGETIAVNFFRKHHMPIKIVRPFNVFGPGLSLEDQRVLPDFMKFALLHKEIVLLSSGTDTRTFCYITDATEGFLRALFSEHNGEAFNIGNDTGEVSMLELAHAVNKIFDGTLSIRFAKSSDVDYLTDNPKRRCPDLTKSRQLLGFAPSVPLLEGLQRYRLWAQESVR
jgi:UDP-glucuronate decarboxylase